MGDEYIITLCIGFVIFVVIVKFLSHYYYYSAPLPMDVNLKRIFGRCAYPDCIRCRRQKEILTRARTRLTYYGENESGEKKGTVSELSVLLKDMQMSYQKLVAREDPYNIENDYADQYPLVLHVKGIQAKPIWTVDEFPGLASLLDMTDKIIPEFQALFDEHSASKSDSKLWKVNDTPNGKWLLCHLIDQGSNTSALERCPVTCKAIQSLPCAMTGNLFSNVAFSVVMPGTTVQPHYGPTNIRLRAHLGLQVPPACHMVVSSNRMEWKEGEILCFDETYLHHVKHDGGPLDSYPRVVLIVDLWHPNLTAEQQKMIDYAFAPEDPVTTVEKGTVVNEVK